MREEARRQARIDPYRFITFAITTSATLPCPFFRLAIHLELHQHGTIGHYVGTRLKRPKAELRVVEFCSGLPDL